MKIKDIGGEFALIKRISKKSNNKNVLVGIGDDCAVIRQGKKLLCITTDTLVEDDHFSLRWFTPKQVGMKAIEINASDIGSMGASPKYALVSLVLTKDTSVEFVDGLYKGMHAAASNYGIDIIGGNITHGAQLVIDIDMIGETSKQNLKLRSMARPGDLIFVSGHLGSSTAGLKMFQKGKFAQSSRDKFKTIIKAHTEPKSHFEFVKPFLRHINAMIDISDGLGSEVAHIAKASKVGAVIFKDNIPMLDETKLAAKLLGDDPFDYALFGGEDFRLVYTVPGRYISKVKGFLVGQIASKKGVRLYSRGKETLLKGHGYNHFL